jgi:hypothetical protein
LAQLRDYCDAHIATGHANAKVALDRRGLQFLTSHPDVFVGLGLHLIPNIGRISTEFVLGGFKQPVKHLASMVNLFADSFNPIGNAGLSMQTLAPTVIDPLAALAENKDWTGKPIAQTEFNSLNPTPGYLRAKDTASELSKTLSYWLNIASGGTDYKKGLISPTPDQLDYLVGQVTGGVGREYLKGEQVVTSTVSGETLPLYKIPLVGRFVGETTGPGAEGGKFYAAVTRINAHEAEVKGLRSEGKFDEAAQYIKDNPEASLVSYANGVESQLRKLKSQKRDLVENGAPRERVKLLEDRITATMRRLNDRVGELSK